MEDGDWYDVEELIRETNLAWLVVVEGQEHWLPMSKCEMSADQTLIWIPEWLAIEEEIA